MSDEIQSLQAVLTEAVQSGVLVDAMLQHIKSPVWSPVPSALLSQIKGLRAGHGG